MLIFKLLIWAIYGLIVGGLAKWLYPGEDPKGCLPTIGIGVAGSYIGGLLNYMLFGGEHLISASGLTMGVIGAVVFLFIFHKVGSMIK